MGYADDTGDFEDYGDYYGDDNGEGGEDSAGGKEPEVGISKFDNMFVCLKCGYKSNRKTNAIVHYKVKHLPQQTATCHICGKEFRNFVGRDRHRKEVHGISKAMMKQGE